MDLDAVIRRRRMCRAFEDAPVDTEIVDRLLERARRAPSAGHTQGWAFVVLEGAEQTDRFWRADADPAWLEAPNHPGLVRAPVIVLPLASRQAYLDRYAEPDKAAAPGGPETWTAPYWTVDTAFATMLLLLGATAEGLGALFFALHGSRQRLLDAFGIPGGWDPIGAVALGWPAPGARPSGSARRGHRDWDEVVRRGGW